MLTSWPIFFHLPFFFFLLHSSLLRTFRGMCWRPQQPLLKKGRMAAGRSGCVMEKPVLTGSNPCRCSDLSRKDSQGRGELPVHFLCPQQLACLGKRKIYTLFVPQPPKLTPRPTPPGRTPRAVSPLYRASIAPSLIQSSPP